MYQSKDITLYVPCYNVYGTIKKCVEGILKQSIRPNRILLLDDGSEPPLTLENAGNSGIEIIRSPENRGLARGRNRALDLCETPLIASLDADVMADEFWLENLLEALNRNGVAGVGGRMDEFYQDTLGDRWRAVHMKQHWGDEPILNPRFLYGANNLFRAEILRRYEAYDLNLRTNYEDMSLCEKLYRNGEKLYYEPAAKCLHLRHDTEQSILVGFWKWFHAKALINGEFDTPEKLIDRIGRVAFGIYDYRYRQDMENERTELLELDDLIPWVFCALDLDLARKQKGLNIPEFPTGIEISKYLSQKQEQLLFQIIPAPEKPEKAEAWHQAYLAEFNKCLECSWVY
jgi:GT2 family glycosyltransferase